MPRGERAQSRGSSAGVSLFSTRSKPSAVTLLGSTVGGRFARDVATTGDSFQPQLTHFWAEDAEEYENEKPLERVEDCKQNLESEGGLADGEGSQDPRQAKQNHNSQQIYGEANVGFPLLLVAHGFAQLVSRVLDQNHNDYDVDDQVE